MKKTRKISEKGQVTLPAIWRKKIKTDLVTFKENNGVLELHPSYVVTAEEVLFSTEENGGKGVSLDDFVTLLEESLQTEDLYASNKKSTE